MNTITFVPDIYKGSIEVDIFIDDEPIDTKKANYIVPSPGAIRASLEHLGKYECAIYTCSCGNAECAGIEMEVLATEKTIAWKMTHPLKFFYSFDYDQYAVAYEAFQKGLQYLLDVRRMKCTDRPEYVRWLLEPL
ncbi:hypothetical protein [Sulfuricurvum sp.]|uniref:hypothetical protein n=1 Tax=Sulfuricurvum sp. TaxID=2025608 RepID=UPI00261299DE|nr:hypothetical protein [Sulfuricurvum sp.]MDD3597667.1 hypothetical protein [Sulfuricurvum sp.]